MLSLSGKFMTDMSEVERVVVVVCLALFYYIDESMTYGFVYIKSFNNMNTLCFC